MEEHSARPSLANYLAFVAVLLAAFFVLPWVMQKINPPLPRIANAPADEKAKKPEADKKAPEKKDTEKKAGEKPAAVPEEKPRDEPVDQTAKAKETKIEAAAKPAVPPDNDSRRWLTLGSADPSAENPYRMLITLSREGGSLARLELSNTRYRDLDDRSGYLGHLIMDKTDDRPGCVVQVVGRRHSGRESGHRGGRSHRGVYVPRQNHGHRPRRRPGAVPADHRAGQVDRTGNPPGQGPADKDGRD